MSQATENRMKEEITRLKALVQQCKEALDECCTYTHPDTAEIALAAIEKELG